MTGNVAFAGTLSRRRFLTWIAGVSGAMAAGPLLAACGLGPAPAAQPPQVYRVGYLAASTETALSRRLRQGLAELGYVDGQNLAIEARGSDIDDQIRAYAAELVGLKLDCIVSSGNTEIRAAVEATRGTAIPVVGVNFADPVAQELAASLARPGGNFTGVTGDLASLDQKRMGVFKEALPSLTRVGLLWTPTGGSGSTSSPRFENFLAAARALGVQLVSVEATQAADIGPALEAAIGDGIDGLYVAQGAVFSNNRRVIVDFAAEHRLPAIYSGTPFGAAGGLLAVGLDTGAMTYRAAALVDKVLRGANPGEIPIELATGLDLVVNLRTAQALGLTFPQSILLQATEVIQ